MMWRATPTRRSPNRWACTRVRPKRSSFEPGPGCGKHSPTSQRNSQMLDDPSNEQWRDAVRNYNVPPETPRDEMWAAIQAKKLATARGEKAEEAERKEAERVGQESRVRPCRSFRRLTYRPVRLGAGLAALLALGIGLGR